jgi:hypothetical protein
MKTQKVKITIRKNNFSRKTKEEMWEVYQTYYTYQREAFMQRIAQNTHFAMYHVNGKLIGFTGIRIDRQRIEGKKRLFIYFCQSVIEQAFRGKSLIQQTGLRLIGRLAGELLTCKAYFWADASTYRAYLVFAKSLQEYYPCRTSPTPTPVKSMVKYLGERHFGDTYSSITGTIHKPAHYVNDFSLSISTEKLSDPDIRFYLGANPLHNQGNDLLVMAPVSRGNVGRLLRRFLKKAWRFQPFFAWKGHTALPVM